MTTALPVSLPDALRQFRLLETAQLEELPSFQGRFPEPKALAGELIRRGWLTPYQANLLLQGRGQELLLGSYVLLARLGEGGMGQVFRARNWKLGKVVALKLIRKERLANPDAIRRFEREVRSAAALNHPNIVHAADADQVGGTHLLVMEYVEGSDLSQLVKKTGPLPAPQACEYIRQAALGLQHAFERGLVHRDVKPANLLLTADGKTVKILDMGLARLDQPAAEDDRSSTVTHDGVVVGTPDYLSPEQAQQSHTVDIRGDLYSLGCTFYYLLTGKPPFPGGSLIEKLLKHRLDEPTPVERSRPDVPPEVADIVRKLMAKKPEDRYQTPAELTEALESVHALTEARPAAAAQTSADTFASPFAHLRTDDSQTLADSPRRLEEARNRRLLIGVAGGVFVLVVLVVLLLLLFKGTEAPKPAVKEEDRPSAVASPAQKQQPAAEALPPRYTNGLGMEFVLVPRQ